MFINKVQLQDFVVVADEGDILVIEPIGVSNAGTAEIQKNQRIAIDQDVVEPVAGLNENRKIEIEHDPVEPIVELKESQRIAIDQNVVEPFTELKENQKIEIDQDPVEPIAELNENRKIEIEQDPVEPITELQEDQMIDEDERYKETYFKSTIRVGLSRKQRITKRLHQYLFKSKTRETQRSL